MRKEGAHRGTRNKQLMAGWILLLTIIIALPFLNYYFGNFYRSSWQDYKDWYPHFFFIVYPLVKIFPLAIFGILIFLLRSMFLSLLRGMIQIPSTLFSAASIFKRAVLKILPGLLISTMTLAIILPVAEFVLRQKGFKPGFRLYSIYFKPVDSLYSIEGFYADSNGIFCIDQSAREFIRNELMTKKSVNELTPCAYNHTPEVFTLPEDFMQLRDTGYHSEFKSFIEKIDASTDTVNSDFFEAVKEYVACPINSNGFRSIEFRKYRSSGKRSVLLLGDSFAWGHSTTNKTNSFADLLLAKGYIVYNTGISGTDPGQYLQVSRILIPRLKPDVVVVNFYMGNDIQYFNREPVPFMPVLYCTNAGNLVSCPEGVYLTSMEEAYDYTLSVFTLPVENNRFNRFCAKTALGTLVWRALAKIGMVDIRVPRFYEYSRKVKEAKTDKPYSDEKLRQIREITRQHGGKFFLIAIPELKGRRFIFPKNHKGLFERLEYFVPPTKMEYFNTYDGHFNDAGSAVYARFIDSLIRVY